MLKSIVNGAEHDIISIPMKGKNLAKYWKNAYVAATGVSPQDKNAMSYPVELKSGDRIRFHTTTNFSRGFATFESFDGTNLSNIIFRGTSNNIDYTAPSDCYAVIWVNLDNNTIMNEQKFNDCKPMLNSGSTPLPYEPYGYQNGWEVRDNQNRLIWGREDELQTTTGNLLFKGYDLPIKVRSLLGNGKQAGGTTTVSQKSVTVAGIESGMDYAMFLKSDFPNVALGDEVNIIVSGTTHSLVVKKIDTQYVYIENEVI